GVLVTQYPAGGGLEWGGRFFALILAIVAPVAVVVLRRVHRHSFPTPSTRAVASVLAAVLTAVLAVGAVRTLREAHVKSAQLLAGLDKAAREARMPFGPETDPRPVVVTTQPLVPQLTRERYDRFR